jgi:Zn-finger nucleic acid-binding protein
MKCPGCKADLVETRKSDVTVDVCSACEGVWFDRGELEAYSERGDGSRVPSGTGSRQFAPESLQALSCPRCDSNSLQMGTINHFEAGLCTACQGVWLSSKHVETTSFTGDVARGAVEVVIQLAFEVILSVVE